MTAGLRYVLRRLGRAPLFSLVAVVTLAIGIGANSAIFSVVNGVLLKPLPFEEPERLVGVWHTAPGIGIGALNQSPAFHFTYKDDGQAFEDVGMWNVISVSVTGLARPEQVQGLGVTSGVLRALRVRPILGRPFGEEDMAPAGAETVILSYPYWQRAFGGEPEVVGRKLVVDGRPRDVIGVLPQGFRFDRYSPTLLLPLRFDRAQVFVGNFSYQALARLKPGVSLEQANADVARMIPLVLEKFPLPPGFSRQMFEEARMAPDVHPLKQDAVGDVGRVLWVLLGTVGLVLLIACANVANLFLVRAEGRQRELAIRSALGAGHGRIARELLGESVTLGIVGGALGLVLAFVGIRLLVALGPESLPRLEAITIDPMVLLFTLGISILAGLLFGVIPVFRYARPHLVSALKEGGRGSSDGRQRHRARSALVVSQIALAMVLLIGSGLMIRSFQALRRVQPGFVQPEQVLTLRISIPDAEVPDEERLVRTHEAILRRIEQIPGVESVGLTTAIPMDPSQSNDPVFVEEFPAPEGQIPPIRRFKWVSERYFETMGIPILAGRGITWDDIYNTTPVVLVTENFAREYWGSPAAALGKRIRQSPQNPWREIVGVTGNVHDDGVNVSAVPIIYWPLLVRELWDNELFAPSTVAYAIRSDRVGTPAFLDEIRQAVWSVSPDLPLANVRTLDGYLADSMARTSFTLIMLAIAGGVALLLGVVGIYGVISYAVSQSTREIGIRMALGAEQGDVSRMFVRHGSMLTGIGVALGLGAAVGLTRVMSALLFGVGPLDPVTYGSVSLGLASVALFACYVPAHRASGVDPVDALRWE